MQANKVCEVCSTLGHSKFYCKKRKPVAIKKVSNKQQAYHEWLESTARPAIIVRDGNKCQCCGRSPNNEEKLDIDHIVSKGSRADLKQDIGNLQLLCRYFCHRNKTDDIKCLH